MIGKIVERKATNKDAAEIQRVVLNVLEEYGLKPDLEGTDRDITDIEAHYLNRGGVFEVIEDPNGSIIGTVGLFPIDSETVELRKMYFLKELRGKGVGKKLLSRMIETAKNLGFKTISLETASVLKEAIGLYEKFGFAKINENHTPRCDVAYKLDISGK